MQDALRIVVDAVSPRLKSKKPVPAETLEVARAVVEGVRRSEQAGLAFRLREWSKATIGARPSNRGALARFRAELRRMEEEIL
ncbi:MAG: hypothetical protein HC923_08310 [Myxococcales bacterium]|nr:hypothetical protein [Myxococcales bacterium]